MATICCKCIRKLTNPLSVKLGISSVCRVNSSLQGVFEFMKVNKIESWNEDIICYHEGRQRKEA